MTGAGKVTSHPGAPRSLDQTQSPEIAVVLGAAVAAGQTTEGVGGITASEAGTAATEGVSSIVVVTAASTIVAELLGMPG